MASAREQLQQLHKAQKRARLPTADDSILEEQLVDEHEEEDSAASDQENRQAEICDSKDLNHHPSLSDYLAALLNDVDKQVDTARAVRIQHSRGRPKLNVIKEQQVINVLNAANFDTDEGLIDAVNLLSLKELANNPFYMELANNPVGK
ncbi:hypothetical protein DdX_20605 [Ditylenchus destructor]|uniref:Uncharacterized protein n=1 Tax=Ditylenchus destructor TaxID=166010 RepID=A0AAD4ML25_9BILA|nr:hypothetical protein DdX_20605 [Ditylenchus destructor]